MNDPILEVIDKQIAQLQVLRSTYLGQNTAQAQPIARLTKATLRTGKAKRIISEATKAKMKIASAARYAREAAAKQSAEPVAASEAMPTVEPVAKEGEAKKKPVRTVVNPTATSAMQSILPNQPA